MDGQTPTVPVDDVKINGTSIVEDGVANVPLADYNVFGVTKLDSSRGVFNNNGFATIYPALGNDIKASNGQRRPITPMYQHQSVFYGLAKASGDTTQSASSNEVGNYTEEAKDKIQTMLGVSPLIAPHESDPFESNHVIGELFIINGKLYRAKTTLTAGEYINEGTNVEVVNTSDVYVKNTDYATNITGGIIKVNTSFGNYINSNGQLYIIDADSNEIKNPNNNIRYKPLTPRRQHEATFYGLAKASGDTTQSASSNVVGQYTEDAKSAISDMLNGAVQISGTDPTIVAKSGIRYVCGEVLSLNFTPSASGICDVVFISGSTPTVLTIPSTIKWANGFDPTSLDANTTYELNIMDGLGVACAWA